MSNAAGFAIIDGRPLHPDTGQSLDGLAPQSRATQTRHTKPTQNVKQHQQDKVNPQPSAPHPVIDGLGGPRRPLPTKTQTQARSQAPKTPVKPVPAKPKPTTSEAAPEEKTAEQAKTEKQLIQSRRLSERRAQRAQQYRQHHAISKFGATKHQDRNQTASQSTSAPVYKPTEELATTAITKQIYRPQGAINQHLSRHDHAENPPDTDTESKQQSLFSWLHPSPRVMKVATVTMSVVVLSAYVAYLNAPNISVRIAASRAGIEAQLPGYTPSGFALSGPVEYETGRVVLDFSSNSDDRQFTIAQEQSRWNSETLRENAVANVTEDYETIQRGGLTIYVWNGSNASWVNQGIRYTLAGDSQLSEQQITQIATSL